jgi:hypothetical protein
VGCFELLLEPEENLPICMTMALDAPTKAKYEAIGSELQELLAADILFWSKQDSATPEEKVDYFLRQKRREELQTEVNRIQIP